MPATKPAIIGGFVLSGLALGVAAILLFGSLHLFSKTQEAVVVFPGSVVGLDVGAPVTFRGVNVGSVKRILLRVDAKDLTARIPVYLELQPESMSISMVGGTIPAGEVGIERMVKSGLKAQLNSSSFLTGKLEVDLDLRPDIEASVTGADLGVPEIPAIPSQLFAGLGLPQLVDTSQQTLRSIQRISDQLGDRIGPFMDNVQKTSSEFHQAASSLNDMISPRSQTRANLDAAIRDLAATASSLRNFSHEVERNPSVVLTGMGGQ